MAKLFIKFDLDFKNNVDTISIRILKDGEGNNFRRSYRFVFVYVYTYSCMLEINERCLLCYG